VAVAGQPARARTELTLVTFDGRLQVDALVRLLAAVALDMRGTRLAHRTAVLALRHWPSLLVDVLERTIWRRTKMSAYALAEDPEPRSRIGRWSMEGLEGKLQVGEERRDGRLAIDWRKEGQQGSIPVCDTHDMSRASVATGLNPKDQAVYATNSKRRASRPAGRAKNRLTSSMERREGGGWDAKITHHGAGSC